MTIELITGTPGAGKTTFAVATRIAKEVGRKITLEDETCLELGLPTGTVVERRVVVAGIRGLKLDHERLPHILTGDATPASEVAKWNAMQKEEVDGKTVESDAPVHQRLPRAPALNVPAIAQNWWLWVKPGDLLVVDEAQFIMPRGTLGRKPPYWLQAFEIHRHYGIDVLIITQHPQLIDTTVRALVSMHRHVRSVMGSATCMVYVWDHASNPERFTLATKSVFRRTKAHYRLFHSSAAHVKPPSSGRSVFPIVAGLALAVWFGFGYFKDRFTAPVPEAHATTTLPASRSAPAGPATAPVASVPVVRGCWTVGPKCSCIGDQGQPLVLDDHSCRASASSFDGLIRWEPSRSVPPPPAVQASAPGRPLDVFAKAQ